MPVAIRHVRQTSVLEILPQVMYEKGSHAFFDWPRWARLSGAHYFRVAQAYMRMVHACA